MLAVPGSIRVADRTVSDAWNHGTEHYTLTGVLAKSSNVGTIMTAQRGRARSASPTCSPGSGWASAPASGCPARAPGRVPPRETWSGSTFGNLPIGQGLSMTALQMAGMYQAVANDGLRVPPRIVAATIGPDGVRVTPTPAPEPVRVVSPETAAQAADDAHRGHPGRAAASAAPAPQAAVPGYQVAGKTGTAQQVDPACGCYASSTLLDHLRRACCRRRTRATSSRSCWTPRRAGRARRRCSTTSRSYLAQRERLPVSADPPPVQTLVTLP